MLKQWEIEYLLDLVNDETQRCEEMSARGINRSLHLEHLKDLKHTLLNTEYEEED